MDEHEPRRVALAHDWLVARRGGELVLEAIASALLEQQPAPAHELTGLYTMFDRGVKIGPSVDGLTRTVSGLDTMPGGLRRWLLPAYPWAIRSLSASLARAHQREPIDLLISTSSVAAKAMKPPLGVPHLCYCHTPARYLWSQAERYSGSGLKGRLRGAGLGVFRDRLRRWDRTTSGHVTAFLANSRHTSREIQRVYGREAPVLHPPVRTGFFTPDVRIERGEGLLVVSALEPYKRVELAIDAARAARLPLTIIGSGSHENALRAHARAQGASQNTPVQFVGAASDEQVRDAMRRARAFLMPQVEDFGITTVEALACGTPVIAFNAGGALDTVIPHETGILLDSEAPRDWGDAIVQLPTGSGYEAMSRACRAHAERFSPARFSAGLLDAVGRVLAPHDTHNQGGSV